MVVAASASVVFDIADGAQVFHHAVAAETHMLDLRLADLPGEGKQAVVIQRLIGKTQQRIIIDGPADSVQGAHVKRLPEINTGNPRAEIRVQRFYVQLTHHGSPAWAPELYTTDQSCTQAIVETAADSIKRGA